jgi:nitroreductase
VTIDELLTTTRAVRKRLDFDRPVDPAVLRECLAIAIQAPTGSNRQGWHFVVVTDEGKRVALAELYRRSWSAYRVRPDAAHAKAGGGGGPAEQMKRVVDSAEYLAANLERAPVHLVPAIEGRLEKAPYTNVAAASHFGSILPAVWSFMLAARSRGLGTAWTTLHLAFEREAAEILGIPYDDVTQVALLPVAHTKGVRFHPAERKPLDEILHWNGW